MDKLIINAAITGMIPTREMTPHVPITVDEIVADVQRCRNAGASIVHLHARAEDGSPTYRKDVNEEILSSVREACADIILCVSTSGRNFTTFEERSEVLDAVNPAPEMASLTLGSMNFPQQASINEPDMIKSLALRMRERGIVPELECFEIGMAEYSHYLINRKVLVPPFYCNILLGSLGTLSATKSNLMAAVDALPNGCTWAVAGIGRYQLQANTMAILAGGHVRVGLEDNIWYDSQRRRLATNAELIERVVGLARSVGREIATPDEARTMIGLRPRIIVTESPRPSS
jgi:3-keto-5-aminohexanoate cleavage enzyme